MKKLMIMSALSACLALPTETPPYSAQGKPKDCPLYLPVSNYEFPHLIVPISYAAPDRALGNSFTPAISPNDFATIFDFDIPTSRAGQTCSLYFAFPNATQLVTTSYTFWGSGSLQFYQYKQNTGASPKTTWNNQPALSGLPVVALTQVSPGHAYKIWTGNCGQGGVWSWRMSSTDSCLWFFQDFNECAIGLYMVYGL